jgi:hypothetical protein
LAKAPETRRSLSSRPEFRPAFSTENELTYFTVFLASSTENEPTYFTVFFVLSHDRFNYFFH